MSVEINSRIIDEESPDAEMEHSPIINCDEVDSITPSPPYGIWSILVFFLHSKRSFCYIILSLGLLSCIALTLATCLPSPLLHGNKLQLKIYSLNNWAIPGNEDKAERLEALNTVLRNETFDIFLLQGLWMEYDHTFIQAALPKTLSITGFRELGISYFCDGRVTRAGCSGLSIIYRNTLLSKDTSSFSLYTYRGSILTTDGTLGKGIGKLRLKSKDNIIVDVFNTHIHDSDPYYQDLQTSELMSYVFGSPADIVILGTCLQSKPDQKPYLNIMSNKVVVNTAQSFDTHRWNKAELYGTYNMPDNHYTPKSDPPSSIFDFVFVGSPLKYNLNVKSFDVPHFKSISDKNISLSNHEAVGATFVVEL